MAGYIGNAPVPQATQTRDNFTATAGQTSFATSGYTPGYLDVYLNGVRLDESDYTATNGSDVVLDTGAALDDVVTVVAFQTFEVNAGISLGDNVKAKFGDSDDLQIHSDGSNSIIKESGSGNLIINGDQVNIANAADTEYKARFNTNGSVQLYYDNAEKLATTSTGIDVTGTVTADRFDVEGSGVLLKAGAVSSVDRDVLTLGWVGGVGDYIQLNVPSADDESGTVRFGSNGNVYFYEDTGSDVKFKWDASNETLGVGSSDTAPSGATTDLYIDSSVPMVELQDSDDSTYSRMYHSAGSFLIDVDRGNTGASSYFQVKIDDSSSKVFKMDSSGNVGIGTTSPSVPLQVQGDGNTLRLDGTANTERGILLRSTGTSNGYLKTDGNLKLISEDSGRHISFSTVDTERMRINSNGIVTMPYQPSAVVHWASNQYVAHTGGNAFVFTHTHANIGNHYSTSNGRFTCPVAGRYLVTFYTLSSSNSDAYYLEIRKNNGIIHYSYQYTRSGHIAAIVNCNANDYLTIGSNASINFFHGANHSKGAFHLLG